MFDLPIKQVTDIGVNTEADWLQHLQGQRLLGKKSVHVQSESCSFKT